MIKTGIEAEGLRNGKPTSFAAAAAAAFAFAFAFLPVAFGTKDGLDAQSANGLMMMQRIYARLVQSRNRPWRLRLLARRFDMLESTRRTGIMKTLTPICRDLWERRESEPKQSEGIQRKAKPTLLALTFAAAPPTPAAPVSPRGEGARQG
jgi:hypothetical protein